MSRNIFGETVTGSGVTFDQNLNTTDDVVFNTVSVGDQYTLPTNSGNAGEVLSTDGAGATSWEPLASPPSFDQSLNTTDDPTFNKINVVSPDHSLLYDSRANQLQIEALSGGILLATSDMRMTCFPRSLAIEVGDEVSRTSVVVADTLVLLETPGTRMQLSEGFVEISDTSTFGTGYMLPVTKGGVNQVLAITDDPGGGNATVGWVDSGLANQTLNTTDSVVFASLTIGNNSLSNYTLPTERGTLNQILKTDASGVTSWTDPAVASQLLSPDTLTVLNLNDTADKATLTSDGLDVFKYTSGTLSSVELQTAGLTPSIFSVGGSNLKGLSYFKNSVEKIRITNSVCLLGHALSGATNRFQASASTVTLYTAPASVLSFNHDSVTRFSLDDTSMTLFSPALTYNLIINDSGISAKNGASSRVLVTDNESSLLAPSGADKVQCNNSGVALLNNSVIRLNVSSASTLLKSPNELNTVTVSDAEIAVNDYKLPLSKGTEGQILKTDAAGVTSWDDPAVASELSSLDTLSSVFVTNSEIQLQKSGINRLRIMPIDTYLYDRLNRQIIHINTDGHTRIQAGALIGNAIVVTESAINIDYDGANRLEVSEFQINMKAPNGTSYVSIADTGIVGQLGGLNRLSIQTTESILRSPDTSNLLGISNSGIGLSLGGDDVFFTDSSGTSIKYSTINRVTVDATATSILSPNLTSTLYVTETQIVQDFGGVLRGAINATDTILAAPDPTNNITISNAEVSVAKSTVPTRVKGNLIVEEGLTLTGDLITTTGSPAVEMYVEDNASVTAVLANTPTKVVFNGGNTITTFNVQFAVDKLVDVGRITYSGMRTRRFHMGCTLSFIGDTNANVQFYFYINKNPDGLGGLGGLERIAGSKIIMRYDGNNQYRSSAIHSMPRMENGEWLELWCEADTPMNITATDVNVFAMGMAHLVG